MNLDLIDNYIRPAETGRDAFERDYQTTEVIFQREDGTFLIWNDNPFDTFVDSWKDCEFLPVDRGGTPFINLENYFDLADLAKQMGFVRAWGMDF